MGGAVAGYQDPWLHKYSGGNKKRIQIDTSTYNRVSNTATTGTDKQGFIIAYTGHMKTAINKNIGGVSYTLIVPWTYYAKGEFGETGAGGALVG